MLTDNEIIEMLRLSDAETFYVWKSVDHVFLDAREDGGWDLHFLYEQETVQELVGLILAYRLSEARRAKTPTL